MISTTIISALVPIGVEGIKTIINRFAGTPKASTVEEQIKLDESDIARLEAIAKLDAIVGTPSQWVVDLRASARYVMAGVVIVIGLAVGFLSALPAVALAGFEAANVAFGFLFGARIVGGLKGK